LEQETEKIEEQKKQLDAREEQLARQKLAIVRGVPVDNIENNFSYHADHEVEQAVERRRKVFEQQLLAADETGQEIVELQDESENLLDTIWLATSPAQLKTLWTKVTELLHENTTPLEKEALAIPPLEME